VNRDWRDAPVLPGLPDNDKPFGQSLSPQAAAVAQGIHSLIVGVRLPPWGKNASGGQKGEAPLKSRSFTSCRAVTADYGWGCSKEIMA
jgi:hypothetical protein